MRDSTLEDYKERLLRVLTHIQQNLDETLDLEELADLACFSPYHFHRVFKGMLGESLKSHIRRLRLERAAMQIRHGSLPVTQIALAAGYETHEAFSRAFKTTFGVSPSRMRLDKKLAAAISVPSGVHYLDGIALTHFKTVYSKGETMDVKINTVNPMRVAFIRHVGPYSLCEAAWDKLCTFMGKEGLIGGDSLFIGVCYDDPEVTPPEKIRYDACLTVDDRFLPTGEIGVQVIAGGQYAVLTHFGPYDGLTESYAKLFEQWLPHSGRELRSDPCFEIYLNSPDNTDPDDLITDIYLPLERT
jgi:AraC family transcriptional regulator